MSKHKQISKPSSLITIKDGVMFKYAPDCETWLKTIASSISPKQELYKEFTSKKAPNVIDARSCFLIIAQADNLSVYGSPPETWTLIYIEQGTYPAILYYRQPRNPQIYLEQDYHANWAHDIVDCLIEGLRRIPDNPQKNIINKELQSYAIISLT